MRNGKPKLFFLSRFFFSVLFPSDLTAPDEKKKHNEYTRFYMRVEGALTVHKFFWKRGISFDHGVSSDWPAEMQLRE
jgi:hypothetical protein